MAKTSYNLKIAGTRTGGNISKSISDVTASICPDQTTANNIARGLEKLYDEGKIKEVTLNTATKYDTSEA